MVFPSRTLFNAADLDKQFWRGMSIVVSAVSLVRQRWTFSMINCRLTDDRRLFITLSFDLCVQHDVPEAARRAGLFATADTCRYLSTRLPWFCSSLRFVMHAVINNDMQAYMDTVERRATHEGSTPARMTHYVEDMLDDLKRAHRVREEQLSSAANDYKQRHDNVVSQHERLLVAYRHALQLLHCISV